MVGVNEDDLVVLVNTVLVDPVRVQHTQVATPPSNTLLRHAPQATLELEVVHTLVDGLAVGGTYTARTRTQRCILSVRRKKRMFGEGRRTLGDLLFPVTPPDANTVDNVSLLGLVTQPAGLVGARGTRCTVNDIELAVLPAAVRCTTIL